jgi:uncharacterized protein
VIFWDTSALLRCYDEQEPSHARAKNLLLKEQGHKGSALLELEAVSGVVRRLRTKAQRLTVLSLVKGHLQHFDLVPIEPSQIDRALRLVERHELRAADALHVAAALALSRELGRKSLRFLTADLQQREAAAAEGLRLIQLSP